MNNEYTFQGCTIPTEETFMTLQPEDGKYPISFGFSANEIGSIYEDGMVFYDSEGNDQYEFKTREDAFSFLFGYSREFEYKHSFYIGSRDDHPTLDGWCVRMGIGVQHEEDGSSVFSAWKRILHK